MKKALCAALALLPAVALGQVPGRLGYQGRILKSDGTPAGGVVRAAFLVYASAEGGIPLWSEEQLLALSDGFYATQLGQVTSFPPALFDGAERWIEVMVGGERMSPRQAIGSVPYALVAGKAQEAKAVSGGAVNATSLSVNGKPLTDSSGRLDFGQLKGCAADGDQLVWNGAAWACHTPEVGITAGAPLTGTGAPGSPLTLAPASASQDGYLRAADFGSFEGKLAEVSASAPLAGKGTPSSPLVIGPSSAAASGYLAKEDWARFEGKLAKVSAAAPLAGEGTPGSPLALGKSSATTNGYLSKEDWAAFTSKLGAVTAQGPLSGAGTQASPLALAPASAVADGYLRKEDFATFGGKLAQVAVQAPLAGAGTATSPVSLPAASAGADGYLKKGDFAAFDAKVAKVTAGTAAFVTGTAQSPVVGVKLGTDGASAAAGDHLHATSTARAIYHFSEGSGSTSADSSGFRHEGTLSPSGATWSTAGHTGGALAFNGTSGFFEVPDSDLLDVTEELTLEAWVFPTAHPTYAAVVGKENSYLMGLVNGRLSTALFTRARNTWEWQPPSGAAAVPLNAWSHVAVSYDGVQIRLYLNGSLVSVVPYAFGPLAPSTYPVMVGARRYAGAEREFFAGRIDEVKVHAAIKEAPAVRNAQYASRDGDASANLVRTWTQVPGYAEVTLNKRSPTSLLKITWSDNFRCTPINESNGAGSDDDCWCYFRVRMDGNEIADPSYCGTGIYSYAYDYNSGGPVWVNLHRPATLTCLAKGAAEGTHRFTVWWRARSTNDPDWPNRSNCQPYLGWNHGQQLLLIEEIEPN